MSSDVKPHKKLNPYRKICKKTVRAHEFWGDIKYFGSLRPRTALQWHRACYILWGTILTWEETILVWGAHAVIWGGTAPECPPVAPGLRKVLRYCIRNKIILVHDFTTVDSKQTYWEVLQSADTIKGINLK